MTRSARFSSSVAAAALAFGLAASPAAARDAGATAPQAVDLDWVGAGDPEDDPPGSRNGLSLDGIVAAPQAVDLDWGGPGDPQDDPPGSLNGLSLDGIASAPEPTRDARDSARGAATAPSIQGGPNDPHDDPPGSQNGTSLGGYAAAEHERDERVLATRAQRTALLPR